MANPLPLVQIVPQPDSRVSFEVDGKERLGYHYSDIYPRPFFYPVIGPSGRGLTRIGHPAAPDHDHHRSVWFAHNDLAGNNFWAEGKEPKIQQKQWVHYQDGDEWGAIVTELEWHDEHNALLMTQELIAALTPLPDGESLIDIQATFRTKIDPLVFNRSNFGLFAVRMAKSISKHYGGGRLMNSDRVVGEKDIFGKPALWMDYSGPITKSAEEGITYLPHPSNLDHPSSWHVRDDGWMCASFTLREEFKLRPESPLTLRYQLYVHGGNWSPEQADARLLAYRNKTAYELVKTPSPWRVWLQESGG